MLNIFVLEDELLQQSRIETIIYKIIKNENLKINKFEIFGRSSQLLSEITERGSHQLFFLDIEIKDEEKKGLEVAHQIRKLDPNATIVFVTTHSEFMPLTFRYKVSALDFIDKALGDVYFYERVKSAIEYTLEKNGSAISRDSFKFESPRFPTFNIAFSTWHIWYLLTEKSFFFFFVSLVYFELYSVYCS